MNRLKMLCLLHIVGALVMAVAPVAVADTVMVEDADDVEDVMDLALADHGHGDSERRLVHTMSTYEAWSSEDFAFADLKFWLPDGDRDVDRVLSVWVDSEGTLVGIVCTADTLGNCSDRRGSARVYQSGERTLVMEFNKRLLKRGLKQYRWKAELHYNCAPPDSDISCTPPPPDTHPGRIRHVL